MSKDFINKCLTIDTKKRITWSQIYEHPLLDAKENNRRAANIGALMSKIDLKKGKEFYQKKGATTNFESPVNNLEEFKQA